MSVRKGTNSVTVQNQSGANEDDAVITRVRFAIVESFVRKIVPASSKNKSQYLSSVITRQQRRTAAFLSSSPKRQNVVCLPFRENYHQHHRQTTLVENKVSTLSPQFIDTQQWNSLLRNCLIRRSQLFQEERCKLNYCSSGSSNSSSSDENNDNDDDEEKMIISGAEDRCEQRRPRRSQEVIRTDLRTLSTQYGYAEVAHLPSRMFNKHLDDDRVRHCSASTSISTPLPHHLTDSIVIESILFENKITIIYRVRVLLRHNRNGDDHSSNNADEKSESFECVAKVVNVRKCAPHKEWTQIRQVLAHSNNNSNTGGDDCCYHKRLRCCPAWSEPIALSKVYPFRFFGSVTFFHLGDGHWYSAVFMPYYSGTLWNLTSKVLPLFNRTDGTLLSPKHSTVTTTNTNGNDNNDFMWPHVLFAGIVQVTLWTLPKAKRSNLVSHNDLKSDNIAYRKTSRQYLYVRIHLPNRRTRPALLSIPTFQRLFSLIDFGWCSFVCAHEKIKICSTCPAYNLANNMCVWNWCTDFAQLAYAMLRQLQEYFSKSVSELCSLNEDWWDLLDSLTLLASTDKQSDGSGGYLLRMTTDNWNSAFYSECSKQCHFQAALQFVHLVEQVYGCTESDIPTGAYILEYDLSVLSATANATTTTDQRDNDNSNNTNAANQE